MSFTTEARPVDPLLQSGLEQARMRAGSFVELVEWQKFNNLMFGALKNGILTPKDFGKAIGRRPLPAGTLLIREENDFVAALQETGNIDKTIQTALDIHSLRKNQLTVNGMFGGMAVTAVLTRVPSQNVPTFVTEYFPIVVPFESLVPRPSPFDLKPIVDPSGSDLTAVGYNILPHRFALPNARLYESRTA